MALTHDTQLTRRIIGLAMRVHTRLGPGMLERAYEFCLCREFQINAIPFECQVPLPLEYEGARLDCAYRADIIVAGEVLLELKSVESILPIHESQLLTCLSLSGCKVGLLLNFSAASLKQGIRRRVLSCPAPDYSLADPSPRLGPARRSM